MSRVDGKPARARHGERICLVDRSTEPAKRVTGAELNRTSYDRIAPQWGSARAAFFGREQAYLDVLLESVPEGATVLDLGCGTGRPMAEYVVSKGRRILGVDQSRA